MYALKAHLAAIMLAVATIVAQAGSVSNVDNASAAAWWKSVAVAAVGWIVTWLAPHDARPADGATIA